MKILSRVAVFPVVPPRISRIYELAYNLWWSWNRPAQELYSTLDPELWDQVNHNPVRFLSMLTPAKLNNAAEDAKYLAHYDKMMQEFDSYMNPKSTWFSTTYPEHKDKSIAYFSAEFGLHEALPIYSGGLGVLAGDHCKAASDLGLPFIGVGFLYPQGYFTQRITREGRQEAIYEKMHFSEVPATPATDPKGNEVMIWVELPGRRVYAKVWRIQVGRIPLFLMDTDVEPNQPNDRDLTARLYGGDHEIRMAQEVVLGIGGVRALRAMGINPTVFHANDSHPVFLFLERVRELVQENGLNFNEAKEVAAAGHAFTTHTPVPAGNDVFSQELIDRFFGGYWSQLQLDRDGFFNLARQEQNWGPGYSMTVLALRLSGWHNGVSKLHGSVSRRMWNWVYPGIDPDEVPINHITNGVHTQTWLAQELDELYTKYLGKDWKENIDDARMWEKVNTIPDEELWEVHVILKHKLIDFVRARVEQMRLEVGEGPAEIDEAKTLFNPDAFTIGFARRFATYKRATLIFRNAVRIQKILNDPTKPIQIIFAGKSHPADEPGKSFIQRVYQISREEGFEGKIVFLENYDMNMARYLISGVDVWLNNPIRPNEASGTSGQKAALNGIPNASILDGWWPEGYNGKNGWAIGEERVYLNQDIQDEADSVALYDLLERDVIPTYYDRDAKGFPHKWINIMKESIRTCAPLFSTFRMLKDYTNLAYVPSMNNAANLSANNFNKGRELAVWKQFIYNNWHNVAVFADVPKEERLAIGDMIEVKARVRLGMIRSEDVAVELLTAVSYDEKLSHIEVTPMKLASTSTDAQGFYHYNANKEVNVGGSVVMAVRILPNHSALFTKTDMGLVRWA